MDLSKIKCPDCGGELLKPAFNRFSAVCSQCKSVFSHKELRKRLPKRSRPKRSRGQRDSQKQEKRVAKRTGGRRTPGSGNTWHTKSDILEKRIRHELKTTRAASTTVKKGELRKIVLEALAEGQLPVFQIDFKEEDGSVETYALLRWEDAEEILGLVRRADYQD